MNKILEKKKGQGEIFGIALFFVIIIIGIIIYGRFAALNNLREDNAQKEEKYKLLAEGTLNSILKLSTGCPAERDKDTLKDLINFCLYSSDINDDPQIVCDDGNSPGSCTYAKKILNGSLHSLYGANGVIGEIPFEFKMELPEYPGADLNDVFSNKALPLFNITTKSERIKAGWKKAPSGMISWATSRRNINFELFLYYK